jgi:transposase-like protein
MGKVYKIAPDVKKDILKKVKDEGIAVSQAAKDHGVTETTIYNWLSKGAKGSPTWSEYSKLKRERDELLRVVGKLTMDMSASQKKNW